jgi:hypothetical protein
MNPDDVLSRASTLQSLAKRSKGPSMSTDKNDSSLSAASSDAAAESRGERSDTVSALERGISVLRCFSEERPVLGHADVARMTGIPRPTVNRLVATLLSHGHAQGRASGRPLHARAGRGVALARVPREPGRARRRAAQHAGDGRRSRCLGLPGHTRWHGDGADRGLPPALVDAFGAARRGLARAAAEFGAGPRLSLGACPTPSATSWSIRCASCAAPSGTASPRP